MPQGDEIQQNFARVGTQEIDAAFDEVNQELDPEKAREMANEIDALIWDDRPLADPLPAAGHHRGEDTLANYGAFGFATARYQDIGFTE